MKPSRARFFASFASTTASRFAAGSTDICITAPLIFSLRQIESPVKRSTASMRALSPFSKLSNSRSVPGTGATSVSSSEVSLRRQSVSPVDAVDRVERLFRAGDDHAHLSRLIEANVFIEFCRPRLGESGKGREQNKEQRKPDSTT